MQRNMKRIFTLEEIPFEEYQERYRGLCIPDAHFQLPKRYFQFFNDVSYDTLELLLYDLEDAQRFLHCVWRPKGGIPLGEARRLTLSQDHAYLSKVRTENLQGVVAELHQRGCQKNHTSQTDIFSFRKEERWRLRWFHIRKLNFPLYQFSGPHGESLDLQHLSLHGISGVYGGGV